MTGVITPFRQATSDDASDMAELVNTAGDGLPLYIWAKLARPGQSPWDVGRERARNGIGGFAYTNTVVREEEGRVAACLIGYLVGDSSVPSGEEALGPLAPLLELQDLVPGSWYVNTLATYPKHRGRGFGTELLQIAEQRAGDSLCTAMSLIASDVNVIARRLYERNGYAEYATRPMVKEGWHTPGKTGFCW